MSKINFFKRFSLDNIRQLRGGGEETHKVTLKNTAGKLETSGKVELKDELGYKFQEAQNRQFKVEGNVIHNNDLIDYKEGVQLLEGRSSDRMQKSESGLPENRQDLKIPTGVTIQPSQKEDFRHQAERISYKTREEISPGGVTIMSSPEDDFKMSDKMSSPLTVTHDLKDDIKK